MLEPGTLKGARGQIKSAYRVAAEITGFVVAFDKTTGGGRVAGTVAASNPFMLAERPLVFVVATKAGAMRWPIRSLTVTDGQLRAELGRLLERE